MPRSRIVLGSIVALVPLVPLVAPRVAAFVPPNRNVVIDANMVFVPGAKFAFGADARWSGPAAGVASGNPQEELTVTSFWIDRTEVTTRAYEACVDTGKCPALPLANGDNYSPAHSPVCNYRKSDHADHPINCVDFDAAKAYCTSVGKRLPTEQEFELAERGSDDRPFPWGLEPPTPSLVNACDASCAREGMTQLSESFTPLWTAAPDDDGFPFTAPVGTYPKGASPYGALDMSGNVEEWVDSPYDDPSTGSSTAAATMAIRGGSWDLGSIDAFAVTRRTDAQPSTRAAWLGFRCARSP